MDRTGPSPEFDMSPLRWISSGASLDDHSAIEAEVTRRRQENLMHFQERTEGEYRIYAGALEAPGGEGYIAAVIVNRQRGGEPRAREAFRDEKLAGGHRWQTAEAALLYAIARGREIVRTETRVLMAA